MARFTWHARAEGREDPLAIGFDVVVLDGERIEQVVGFLDKVPSGSRSARARDAAPS